MEISLSMQHLFLLVLTSALMQRLSAQSSQLQCPHREVSCFRHGRYMSCREQYRSCSTQSHTWRQMYFCNSCENECVKKCGIENGKLREICGSLGGRQYKRMAFSLYTSNYIQRVVRACKEYTVQWQERMSRTKNENQTKNRSCDEPFDKMIREKRIPRVFYTKQRKQNSGC